MFLSKNLESLATNIDAHRERAILLQQKISDVFAESLNASSISQ